MTNQIATTPEQSQRLIACGVNPDSADMAWKEDLSGKRLEVLNHPWIENLRNLHYSPAWSLAALLAQLPREIQYPELQPSIKFDQSSRFGWSVSYYDYYMDDSAHEVRGFDLIEGCLIMIEWLTQNGYKLNKD